MSILVFLIVFSIIVTIHEFGHYYVAKKSGVLVREFALGMGPKIVTWRKGETTFTIRALPLGGFVRMAGDDDEVEVIQENQHIYITLNAQNEVIVIDTQNTPSDKTAQRVIVQTCDLVDTLTITGRVDEFSDVVSYAVYPKAIQIEKDGTHIQIAPRQVHLESASVWQRIAIYLAGPISNFVLSIVVFMALAFVSGSVASNSNAVDVVESGAAESIGMVDGDKVIAIDEKAVASYDVLVQELTTLKQTGKTIVNITFEHDGTIQNRTVTLQDGKLGVYQTRDTSFMAKMTYGWTQTYAVVKQVWGALVNIVTSGFKLDGVGGPLAIVQASGQVAQAGILSVFAFLAMISANLGVMNLLPIPALDGGKILLGIVELLRGKPISKQKEMMVTLIGAGLLILLTVFVTFNDIMRLFVGK